MDSLSVAIAILLQLFVFCILGEFLTNKAKYVNEKLYSSYWYEIINIDDRRKLLLLIMNSQKTAGFTAGGFTYLCLSTFGEVHFDFF
jgi:lipopolysaccharide biosynthesis protein